MASMIRENPLAYLAGAIGIIGQLASAYWFLLYPLLVVPTPASYAFFVAWFVLVGLTLAWWRHHPIRSFVVPIVSVPAVNIALGIGTRFLGWAP
jgi:hypothetical protein